MKNQSDLKNELYKIDNSYEITVHEYTDPTVTVTDKRGRTATSTTNFTVLAYTEPTISKFTVVRANSDGTTVSANTSVTTLDIARITAGPDSWSIEDFAELSISNKAGCTMSLYLSYNNYV